MENTDAKNNEVYTDEDIDRAMADSNRYREQRRKALRKKRFIRKCAGVAFLVVAVVLIVVLSFFFGGGKKAKEEKRKTVSDIIAEADFVAAGYDYDKAVKIIKEYEKYEEEPDMMAAIESYEKTKSTMVLYENVHEITHVFFHTLIVDTELAFDGDYKDPGYNQYMTTVSEFNKMMEEMYKRGFVLVDIHDIAKEEKQPDGSTKFVPGEIWLPEGKEPFVMSQDDVSYYGYMLEDGFATKLVIGEDGMPTCEYVKPDGSVVYGDYDLVPALETFIRKHPDFSYRGARAALALTGYDGVLGYRTSPTGDGYNPEDIEKAKKVADRMKECGWTFASHSWGHQKYGVISHDKMKTDAEKWEKEVQNIVGDTDVLIYANGYDIAGIEAYSGEKFETLKSFGFKYFCNVDSSRYWVQIGDDYVRQGRRNLDGYRMWYSPKLLEDLFKVEDVWDQARPKPVPPI